MPVLTIAGTVVGLLVAVLLYRTYAAGAVRFQVTSFTVRSDRQVQVVFEVQKDAGSPATCYLRARARDGAEVGGEEVAIPAGPASARVDHTLTTTGRAVTGEVVRCVAG